MDSLQTRLAVIVKLDEDILEVYDMKDIEKRDGGIRHCEHQSE